jgi:hypothetical protein
VPGGCTSYQRQRDNSCNPESTLAWLRTSATGFVEPDVSNSSAAVSAADKAFDDHARDYSLAVARWDHLVPGVANSIRQTFDPDDPISGWACDAATPFGDEPVERLELFARRRYSGVRGR